MAETEDMSEVIHAKYHMVVVVNRKQSTVCLFLVTKPYKQTDYEYKITVHNIQSAGFTIRRYVFARPVNRFIGKCTSKRHACSRDILVYVFSYL